MHVINSSSYEHFTCMNSVYFANRRIATKPMALIPLEGTLSPRPLRPCHNLEIKQVNKR